MGNCRGFTLVEVLVAVAIGTSVTVAALVLTADMQRYSHRHMGELGTSQRLRDALELLSHDLRNAGVGVGYSATGNFEGMIMGTFQAGSSASFQADNRSLTTVDGQLLTDDIGLRIAEGERRTILYLESGTGMVCAGQNFSANELVMATSRNGQEVRTLRVLGSSDAACTRGSCTGGCQQFTYSEDETYQSDSSVVGRAFSAGDLYQEFETVVWFVAVDADGNPALRRASDETLGTCTAVDATCGAEVADGIISVQYDVYYFDSTTSAWVLWDKSQAIATRDPLRIDLEIIGRARSNPQFGRVKSIQSQLEPSMCVPTTCGSDTYDKTPRAALRTTIEVRNAGYLSIE